MSLSLNEISLGGSDISFELKRYVAEFKRCIVQEKPYIAEFKRYIAQGKR